MTEDGRAELDELEALLADRGAELDPELAAYLEEESLLGFPTIRHPLVYSVPHFSNALANRQLAAKKEMVARARRQRDWSQYLYLHERPYRLDAFAAICYRLGDQKYWELLGSIWTDTENMYQNEQLWRDCLTAERRYRSRLMSVDERKALAHDIDKTDNTIYRGFSVPGREAGLSWTTNSVVAKSFARRAGLGKGEPRYLATGKVARKDIIAFFDGRSEYEVVVLPENVRDIAIEKIEGEGR